ncbi:hypothetical protein [Streptomyces sp. NPDC051014]|uniref:hypothetical protein n=1 Tax=Streptomyces sp. NPDC051014 TaxID=3155751 RepID=UPI0033F38154
MVRTLDFTAFCSVFTDDEPVPVFAGRGWASHPDRPEAAPGGELGQSQLSSLNNAGSHPRTAAVRDTVRA